MKPQTVTVNRSLVGVIALLLLGAAAVLTVRGADGSWELWSGACLKIGLVMGAFWLAMPVLTRNPELGRTSLATLLMVILGALLIARSRVPLNVIVPVLGAFLFFARILRPRPTTSPPRLRE